MPVAELGFVRRLASFHFNVRFCFHIMTDNQWTQFCTAVLNELRDKPEFTVGPSEARNLFGLSHPYYREMVRRAEAKHPGFYFECGWMRTDDGDPLDHVRFYTGEPPL